MKPARVLATILLAVLVSAPPIGAQEADGGESVARDAAPGEADARETVSAETGARDRAPVVFRDVSVLTMEEDSARSDHTVIVEGDSIAWIGPAGEARVPEGAIVVEGRGRYLLPGLADMHAHADPTDLPLFLANGVTTIREMNGSPAHLAVRDSIEAGLRRGPRLIVSSTLLTGAEQPWRHVLVEDAEAARRTAREMADLGYDALKVYDGLSAAAYAALVEVSRARGLPLVGHVPEAVGLDGVLAAGQRTIEHVEQIAYATVDHDPDPAAIPGIVERIAASPTWVVPTLAAQRILTRIRTPTYDAGLEAPEVRFVDPGLLDWWKTLKSREGAPEPSPDDPRRRRAEAFFAFQRDLARALHDAGVPMLVGTDTPNPLLVPGFSIHLELAALADAGIPPIDVLGMATRDAAAFAGAEGAWGVIAPGAAADLVLVDENPLDRLETLEAPAGVMVGGEWLDRAALDRLLEERGGGPAGRLGFVDDALEPLVGEETPGLAIAVVHRGEVLHRAAYGTADLETEAPFGTSTPSYVASVAKMFTATAIATLVEEGRLDWDDRLGDLLPGAPAYGADVTVRQMLAHTSGLPDHYELAGEARTYSDADVLDILRGAEGLLFEPGTDSAYSNSAYVLLARIVERVSGSSFGAFLETRFFEPLGMEGATVIDGSGPLPADRACGYDASGERFAPLDYGSTTTGAGGVYASLDDLVRWGEALGSGRLVDEATLEILSTPVDRTDGRPTPWGLGWLAESAARGPLAGKRYVAAIGELRGFQAGFQWYPEEDLMLAWVANSNAPGVFDRVVGLPERVLAGE